jgi:hypothetical protein
MKKILVIVIFGTFFISSFNYAKADCRSLEMDLSDLNLKLNEASNANLLWANDILASSNFILLMALDKVAPQKTQNSTIIEMTRLLNESKAEVKRIQALLSLIEDSVSLLSVDMDQLPLREGPTEKLYVAAKQFHHLANGLYTKNCTTSSEARK